KPAVMINSSRACYDWLSFMCNRKSKDEGNIVEKSCLKAVSENCGVMTGRIPAAQKKRKD
ncbi:hypothetical protein J6590_106391, partial [Homalodisca vitripennis]